MTETKKNGVKLIPAEEVFAEWRKDPEYVAAYESLKPKYDRLRRQIDRRIARRQRRAVLVARVREVARDFWHWLTHGLGRGLAPS